MTTKTITVTEEAYEALKSLKEPRESFSEIILRVSKRKPLYSFFGALSKESGEKLEKTIMRRRRRNALMREERIKRIVKELKE